MSADPMHSHSRIRSVIKYHGQGISPSSPNTSNSLYEPVTRASSLTHTSKLSLIHNPKRTVRSQSQKLFSVPRVETCIYGYQNFSISAACLWNNLPAFIKSSDSRDAFKRKIKTVPSTRAFQLARVHSFHGTMHTFFIHIFILFFTFYWPCVQCHNPGMIYIIAIFGAL